MACDFVIVSAIFSIYVFNMSSWVEYMDSGSAEHSRRFRSIVLVSLFLCVYLYVCVCVSSALQKYAEAQRKSQREVFALYFYGALKLIAFFIAQVKVDVVCVCMCVTGCCVCFVCVCSTTIGAEAMEANALVAKRKQCISNVGGKWDCESMCKGQSVSLRNVFREIYFSGWCMMNEAHLEREIIDDMNAHGIRCLENKY